MFHALNERGWIKADPLARAKLQQFARGLLDRTEGKPFGYRNEADTDHLLDSAYRRGWHSAAP